MEKRLEVSNLWREGESGLGIGFFTDEFFSILHEAHGRLLWIRSPNERRQINNITFSTVNSDISTLQAKSNSSKA